MNNGFLKRFISILLSLSLTILMSPASFASTSSSEDKKYKSYQDVIDSAVVHGVPLDLTYEDYIIAWPMLGFMFTSHSRKLTTNLNIILQITRLARVPAVM